jgi:hypothetical protein
MLRLTLALCAALLALGMPAAKGQEDPPGTSCDLADVGGASPSCDDEKWPYCVAVTTTTQECRQCLSTCDCPTDQYCSSKPGDKGLCKQFEQLGKACQPMTPAQLANSDYKEDTKCAAVFSDNNVINVDHAGGCLEGVCQYCNADSLSSTYCQSGQGLKTERVCVYPGVAVRTRTALWAEGIYHTIPSAVWAAITFVFFILVGACQIAQLVSVFTDGGKGE